MPTASISYAEPNFKIPLPHFYFTFTNLTAIYGLDGMSIVNSPLWRPAGVIVMFQVSMISDEDILKLKDLPIWFTHAKTDPVVVPDDFVVPTYERLAKVNPNAHFTYWDKVLDHTGTQKNADGTPFEYIGHWSWIPMLNDECVLDYDGRKRDSDSGVDGCTEKSITQHLPDSPPTADCCSEKNRWDEIGLQS